MKSIDTKLPGVCIVVPGRLVIIVDIFLGTYFTNSMVNIGIDTVL